MILWLNKKKEECNRINISIISGINLVIKDKYKRKDWLKSDTNFFKNFVKRQAKIEKIYNYLFIQII